MTLVPVGVIIVDHVKTQTNAQNVHHLNKCTHGTSDRGLSHAFNGPIVVLNCFTDIKNALVKCIFIFNLNRNTAVFKCFYRKNSKGLMSVRQELSICQLILVWTFFLLMCEWKFVQFVQAFKYSLLPLFLWIYIYIYIYIFIYIYTYIYKHTHTHTHSGMREYLKCLDKVHICMYICMYVCTYVCT